MRGSVEGWCWESRRGAGREEARVRGGEGVEGEGCWGVVSLWIVVLEGKLLRR